MIKRFFATLRAARHLVRHCGYVPAPEWTPDDLRNLLAFTRSKTGAKLNKTLLALTVRNYFAISRRKGNSTDFEVGHADGFNIDSLMIQNEQELLETETKIDDTTIATDDLEWMSQTHG